MITKEQLISCIKNATVQMYVKVDAKDFYSSPGDLDDQHISYVDADQLITEIEALDD